MPAKWSPPVAANWRDRCSWSAASTLTANRAAALMVLWNSACKPTQTKRSGGSSETDESALAVIPAGRPLGSSAVTTVTPVANRPSSCRNWVGAAGGGGVWGAPEGGGGG